MAYKVAYVLNFLVFLRDGIYPNPILRILSLRMTNIQENVRRQISFEYMNKQLIWHAFTEFLLFLIPLVRPDQVRGLI